MLELKKKEFPEINILWQIGLQKNIIIFSRDSAVLVRKGAWYNQQLKKFKWIYEGWNFNSGNYLFTTDTK